MFFGIYTTCIYYQNQNSCKVDKIIPIMILWNIEKMAQNIMKVRIKWYKNLFKLYKQSKIAENDVKNVWKCNKTV